MSIQNRSLTILQVEDTTSDAILTAHALKTAEVQHTIHVVPDGKQALAFLRHQDGFEGSPRPDLIFLDLSLPGLNGQEVLGEIKMDATLKTIPIVVFTTLDTDESRRTAYELCANSYVVKPVGLAEFTKTVQAIVSYWSQTSRHRPPHDP